MAQHAAIDSHRVHHKPREKGSAHSAAHHERRHKSVEGKYGIIGSGATITGTTIQTTTGGGDPANYYPGIVYDANGLRAYNSGGVVTMTISAADGSVTVNGTGVITGGTIQTSATNPRVVMDGNGIKAFNSGGTQTFFLAGADGSLTVGSSATITGGVIQTSAGGTSRVIMDANGIRAYDASGNNTVGIDTTGALTVAKGSITLSSTIPAGTGARVTLDSGGIKGFNSSNTLQFQLDATTGLITATGVLTANAGSNIPTNVISGFLPSGANRYSNSAFQNGANSYDASGWTISNAANISGGTVAPPVYGSLTMKLTASAAGDVTVQASTVTDPYKRVLPGISYTFSHYVYPTSTARQTRVDIKWYDSTGTLLSTVTGAAANTALNTWSRPSTTATAPVNAAYAIGVHYIGIAAANTEVFYTECFMMEEGDRVDAWSPRPDEVLVNQINANNINVANLAAISANLGTITAGTITGVTITGATVQTSSSDPRTALDSTGFWASDASANKSLTINTSGIRMAQGGPQKTIIWTNGNSASGTQLGSIYVGGGSGESTMFLTAWGGPAGYYTQLELQRSDSTDTSNAAILNMWNASGSLGAQAFILDGLGRSSFLQVAGVLSQLAVATGNSSVSWSASASSTVTNITHGLGRTPAHVILTLSGFTGTISTGTTLAWGNGTSTQFSVWGWRSASSTITLGFDWIAFG